MRDDNSVIIYCDHLLYPSETFIRAQATSLTHFRPTYAGLRRVKGLELPSEAVRVINAGDLAGRLKELTFKLLRVAPGFTQQLRALRPKLLHAHFGADGFRAMPIARRLQVPLVVSFHGSDATVTKVRGHKVPYGHRQYLNHRPELQKQATQFIAVSHFIKRKMLDQGFPEDKVRVHYIGVDTELFSPGVEEAEPMVLFVGRLTERKGVEYLIRAMVQVQSVLPDLELVIIGDGHLRSKLETLAKGTLQKYRFLGVQTPDQVRSWMRRTMLFAAPSISTEWGEEEGLGMVFLEAQAMEKPVVSFASGGIPEAVEHGVTGRLAPMRDEQQLAQDILLIAQDASLRSRMGRSGRQRVLQSFDLRRQTVLLEELYEDAINRFAANTRAEAKQGEP